MSGFYFQLDRRCERGFVEDVSGDGDHLADLSEVGNGKFLFKDPVVYNAALNLEQYCGRIKL